MSNTSSPTSHLETSTELELSDTTNSNNDALYNVVQGRTLAGVLSLTVREGAMFLLGLGGSIILARFLLPQVFGLFAIANFAISFFSLFGELGLGAALIRKADRVADSVLEAMFTLQLLLSLTLALLLFSAAPFISSIYHYPEVTWLIRALAIALVATMLRSVPIILAERELNYSIVAITDISSQVIYWIVVIPIAISGGGVWSFVVATIVSAVGGTIILFLKSRWTPSLNFNWQPLKEYLQFGLFYQGQSLSHFAKDTLIPSLGGILYGSAAVGYLTWANQLASIPLQVTHIVSRVSYPALARLQHDQRALTRLLENSLGWTCKITFPVFAILGGLAPQLTEFVYGARWLPSLPALYIFEINMLLGVGTGLFMPVLYSSGRARTALTISVAWTIMTMVFVLLFFVAGIGFTAVAAAYTAATALAAVVIVHEVKRLTTGLRVFDKLVLPLVGMLAITLLLRLVGQSLIHNLLSLIVAASIAGLVGLIVNIWEERREVIALTNSFLNTRVKGNALKN